MVTTLLFNAQRLLRFLIFIVLAGTSGHAAEFAAGFVTDGTRAGGYSPQNIRLIDNEVYFAGIDATNSLEPRLTNSSAPTGAILLGDLFANGSSNPGQFTKAGTLVFFSARDSVNGTELWATDGTPQGTRLVKNIAAGPTGSNPADFIECQGKLLFTADDGSHGRELWVSDGSTDGTKLVVDINTNGSAGANIAHLFNWNGIVYFAAQDGVNNEEVWHTDGTPEHTALLKDLNDSSADPSGFTVFQGALYFQANSTANAGIAELWKTDGLPGGTVLVKNIPGSTSGVEQLTVVGNQLFFAAPTINHEFELWVSNGTAGGTHLVKDIGTPQGSDPENLTSYQGALFFVANDGSANGRQLWKSDGTESGTVMVHPTFNGVNQAAPLPNNLVVVGNTLLFQQNFGTLKRRWVQSDGSSAEFGLVTADAILAIDDPESFVTAGNRLVFTGRISAGGTTKTELFLYAPKLTVTTPPASRLVATGSSVSFTVSTSFTDGVTYQWQHDGHDIPGAILATYTINSASLTDGGHYHAIVSNGAPVVSPDAVLGVVERTVADANAPVGGKLIFKVNTTGTGLTYQWKHPGGTSLTGARFSGLTGATLQIAGVVADDAGAYTCDVTLGNETVTTLAATATIITKPVVTNTAPPPCIISGAYQWQLAASQAPASFTVTGLPRGLSFDAKTGIISGTPRVLGKFTVKVVARNAAGPSAAQSFQLIVGELPIGVPGTFTGTISRDVNLNGQLGGSTRLTVSRTGVVTGQALLGLLSYTVRGNLDAPLLGNPTAALLATHAGKPSVTLNVTFDGPGQAVSGTAGAAAIRGRLLVWNVKTNPALAYAGSYNTSLSLPQSAKGNLSYPQGCGFLQVKVATSGAVTVSGQMADGAPVTTYTSALWPDGSFPVLRVLYAGHGSLLGTGQITLGPADPGYPGNRVAGATLLWQKIGPASARDHTYAGGFPNVALTSDGSKWLPPHGVNLLAAADSADNTQIAFSDAGIQNVAQHQSVNQTFTLTPASIAKFTASRNPCGVKATFYPLTGRFSGSMVLTDPNPTGGLPLKRTVPFSGIVLQHRSQGVGYFLLPSLPAPQATPAIQGGLVSVMAVQ